MNRLHRTAIVIATTSSLLSGCASIISDSNWPVTIRSTPDNASFSIVNQKGEKVRSGTTPATFNLASGAGYFDGETYTLTFKKAGYQETTAILDTNINGWYWLNILFGGIYGLLIIDPTTGAMFRLPESFTAELGVKVSLDTTSPEQEILSLNDIPAELRSQLIPIR